MHVAKAILLSLVAHKGPADDGKRSEAEWTLCVSWNTREGGSGGRGYRKHVGWEAGGSVKNGSKNGSPFLHDEGTILGFEMM